VQTRHAVPLIVLLCALLSVAACSSSGSSSKPTAAGSSAPATSSTTGSHSAAPSGSAVTEITTNWTAFFNPKTPVAKRVSLLENGQQFASIIQAQAGSALASSASAKVSKVTVTSPAQAKVTYTILVAGTPALPNQAGIAVLQGGTWKVGAASFCGLLSLENGGKAPAVCKTAG
jgi:hypothetical protein